MYAGYQWWLTTHVHWDQWWSHIYAGDQCWPFVYVKDQGWPHMSKVAALECWGSTVDTLCRTSTVVAHNCEDQQWPCMYVCNQLWLRMYVWGSTVATNVCWGSMVAAHMSSSMVVASTVSVLSTIAWKQEFQYRHFIERHICRVRSPLLPHLN